MADHPPVAQQADPAAAPHPELLERLDGPYLVPWGLPQIQRTSVLGGMALLAALALAWIHSAWWLTALVPVALLGGFFVLFFRNPRRQVAAGPQLLVSPADGTVWDITSCDEPEFLQGPALRIGIFLSIFDVHVNRAPCDARVEWTRHRPGRFHDARSAEAARENEANDIALVSEESKSGADARLLVRQISGAVARRIVAPLKPQDRLRRGGLIGMIKYGSRTEVWIPRSRDFEVQVSVGDKVRGGETVLGRFVGASSWDDPGPQAARSGVPLPRERTREDHGDQA